MKQKKGLLLLFTILAVVLIALLGAKPLYNLYRDVSFSWVERSETEKKPPCIKNSNLEFQAKNIKFGCKKTKNVIMSFSW